MKKIILKLKQNKPSMIYRVSWYSAVEADCIGMYHTRNHKYFYSFREARMFKCEIESLNKMAKNDFNLGLEIKTIKMERR